MSVVKCPTCNQRFPLLHAEKVKDDMTTICPCCSDFIILSDNDCVELSGRDIERIDEVSNSVYDLFKVLTEDKNMIPEISDIEEVLEFAMNTLYLRGYKIKVPSIVSKENGDQYIEKYYDPDMTILK
jgi:hypothetical protein